MAKPICLKCLLPMEKERSGLIVKVDDRRSRKGDLFKCPECGIEILSDFRRTYMDYGYEQPDYKIRKYIGKNNASWSYRLVRARTQGVEVDASLLLRVKKIISRLFRRARTTPNRI